MTIALDNLGFSYGRMQVLRNITARAEAGRITAILGPNAAGKSTLLRCAIGALKPSQGSAVIDGKPVQSLHARELASHLAYVSQRPVVSAAFTVRQVVELGRYALTADAGAVQNAIERMELVEIADRPYPALSVGQQQRVALARALAQLGPAQNLVLDEPASAMDLRHVAATMTVLRELADQGCTVLLAMHDLPLAAGMADDVWLLDRGGLVAAGPTGDVMTLERLRAVFGVEFQWIDLPDGGRMLASRLQHAVRARTSA